MRFEKIEDKMFYSLIDANHRKLGLKEKSQYIALSSLEFVTDLLIDELQNSYEISKKGAILDILKELEEARNVLREKIREER